MKRAALSVVPTPDSLTPISDLLERVGTSFKWVYSSSMRLEATGASRRDDGAAVIHLTASLRYSDHNGEPQTCTRTFEQPVREFLVALETGLLTPTEDARS